MTITKCCIINWASSRENLLLLPANSEGTDQRDHPPMSHKRTSSDWLKLAITVMSTSDELNFAQERSTSGFVSADRQLKID